MKRFLIAVLTHSALLLGSATAQPVKPDDINKAERGNSRAAITKLQILLDRARFSPGVIDGRMGENVENAVAAFRKERGIKTSGTALDEETWAVVSEDAPEEVIVDYTITEEDVKGPFTKNIPDEFEKKKDLARLGYKGPAELLSEKFHMDEGFLEELNPGANFSKVGASIKVTNIERDDKKRRPRAKRLVVEKSRKQVRAYSDSGELLAVFPATIGSSERPAPTGRLKVKGVAENPTYTYNPDYKFQGVDADKPFTIAPGPNNPVGMIWIDLSKEGYGIHGTPEPAQIGKTSSHGCVRLTNWDAKLLGEMVKTGVDVDFQEGE